jgi:hypothetical protein
MMDISFNRMEREQKIAFVQAQLICLQQNGKVGLYGFDALEQLRMIIRNICPVVKEEWNEGFVFSVSCTEVCRFNWYADKVQFLLFEQQVGQPLQYVHEYKNGSAIPWTAIKAKLRQYRAGVVLQQQTMP